MRRQHCVCPCTSADLLYDNQYKSVNCKFKTQVYDEHRIHTRVAAIARLMGDDPGDFI